MILVATHKLYWMPKNHMYQPILVGAEGKENICHEWLRDDLGELQISQKNGTFCELTGLYWAWKNLKEEPIGLCQYRRYFGRPGFFLRCVGSVENRLLREDISRLLEKADVILPQKRHYWIETRKSQYIHAHHEKDLEVTENVLKDKYPMYLTAWYRMLNSRSGHICNMFIMHREKYLKRIMKSIFLHVISR